MPDPWAFGWNQLLTIIGILLTLGIALGGFRTFGRWKKEKIEERRIEIAFDALALAYETKFIFDRIRQPIAYEIEHTDMAVRKGESAEDRQKRGAYYAILHRMSQQSEFFDRVWLLMPKTMAVFGKNAEEIFQHILMARGLLRMAGLELAYRMPLAPEKKSQEDFNLRVQYREDLWGNEAGDDRVSEHIIAFRKGIEELCKPIVTREFNMARYQSFLDDIIEAGKEA
jgi:hypothetical protein